MAQLRPDVTGQTGVETVLLLPLFFLLAFSIIQACHLGIAVAIVNYGASAVARQAVQENNAHITASTNYQSRFDNLMFAGLKSLPLQGGPADQSNVTSDVKVTACAKLTAYPFVGQFLDQALRPSVNDPCGGTKSMGPVSLRKGPNAYEFLIRGEAKARMNYSAQ